MRENKDYIQTLTRGSGTGGVKRTGEGKERKNTGRRKWKARRDTWGHDFKIKQETRERIKTGIITSSIRWTKQAMTLQMSLISLRFHFFEPKQHIFTSCLRRRSCFYCCFFSSPGHDIVIITPGLTGRILTNVSPEQLPWEVIARH